ncbi:MAG: universal stress protein, partial [Gemmatimonadota bacterium]
MEVNRILVPLDESSLSTLSLDPAYEIARRFGATVQLLMVVDDGAAAVLQKAATSENVSIERAAAAALARAASESPDVSTDVKVIFDDDPAHT